MLSCHYQGQNFRDTALEENKEVPNISLECVMKTAGLIESMGKGRLKPRKAA